MDLAYFLVIYMTSLDPWLSLGLAVLFPALNVPAVKLEPTTGWVLIAYTVPLTLVLMFFVTYVSGANSPAWLMALSIMTATNFIYPIKGLKVPLNCGFVCCALLGTWFAGGSFIHLLTIAVTLLTVSIVLTRISSFLENQKYILRKKIRQRKRAEEELGHSQETIRALADNLPEFITLKDEEGRFLFVNKRFEEWVGLEQHDVVGKTVHDIYPPEQATEFDRLDREVIAEQLLRSREIDLWYPDGKTRPVVSTRFPVVTSSGTTIGIGTVNVDISELKQVEEALRESEERLKHQVLELTDREQRLEEQAADLVALADNLAVTRDDLQLLNNQKDKFFAVIAHDLKSPFNALLGFSQVLSTQAEIMSSSQVVEYSSLIHRAADQAFKLLEDLLDWSRLQLGRMDFEPMPVKLHEIIQTSLTRYQSVSEAKGVGINESGVDDLIIFADPNMVATVLRNLISNAIKFTPEKGCITISAKQIDNHAEISVSDNGVGMLPDKLARLFQIDDKVSTSGTAGETGTGLGLQLCKELIEKQSGQIHVESAEGVGSTFRITLPLYSE